MRRLISVISASVALAALGFVLINATTVDRRPPVVQAITLSATAGDPQVAQTLTAIDIEFSEPVRPETAEPRFHIDPPVDGAFAWNGSTAIFTPSRKLPSNTSFTLCSAMYLRAAGRRTSFLSFSWRKMAGGCARRS